MKKIIVDKNNELPTKSNKFSITLFFTNKGFLKIITRHYIRIEENKLQIEDKKYTYRIDNIQEAIQIILQKKAFNFLNLLPILSSLLTESVRGCIYEEDNGNYIGQIEMLVLKKWLAFEISDIDDNLNWRAYLGNANNQVNIKKYLKKIIK